MRDTTITFPPNVKPTPCTNRTFSVTLPTAHGVIHHSASMPNKPVKIQRNIQTGKLITSWEFAPETARFEDVEE